jgi:DNA-binding MarR family transcriptional regulator
MLKMGAMNQKHTPEDQPGELEGRIGFALRRAQHRLRALSDEALRPFQLTTPQFSVLIALKAYPGASGAALARLSLLTPQTMHGIVKNLEEAGLIVRKANPGDGRVLDIALTSAGSSILKQADIAVRAAESALTHDIAAPEIDILRRLLLQCADD